MTLRIFSLFALLLFLGCASTSSSTTRKPNWVCEVPLIGGALLLDVPRLDVLDFELVELEAGVRLRNSSAIVRMSCVRAIDVRVDALPPVPAAAPVDALPPEPSESPSAAPDAAPSSGP
jgi:hypothetical protein